MSLLKFLRVIEALQPRRKSDAPPPRSRKLELESLERRTVLTLEGTALPAEEPLLGSTTEVVQSHLEQTGYSEALTTADSGTGSGSAEYSYYPDSDSTQTTTSQGGSAGGSGYDPPEDYTSTGGSGGGSGSGSGDPSPESSTASSGSGSGQGDGGSQSGTGDPDPQSSQGGSGSGSGGGTSEPDPTGSSESGSAGIESLYADRDGLWVWFAGTTEGLPEGTVIYFTVGDDPNAAFTAVVGPDGTFMSGGQVIDVGVEIRAYFLDANGNPSPLAACVA